MIDLASKTEGCGCDLQKEIVNNALCTGCGTCAMSCQTRAVTMVNGRPEFNSDRCIKCGICSIQCPRSWWPEERIKKLNEKADEYLIAIPKEQPKQDNETKTSVPLSFNICKVWNPSLRSCSSIVVAFTLV